jgi:hypothetical protein
VKTGTRALGVAESYVGTTRDGRPASEPDEDGGDAEDGSGKRNEDGSESGRTDGAGTAGERAASPRSTFCGAVVRADRVLDGLGFEACTVGGTDATAATVRLVERLARPDVRFVLLAGVAPAWFNLLDLDRVHRAADRPTVAVSFEASGGLESALREAFDGTALERRLETYRALPPRRRVTLDEATVTDDGGDGGGDADADEDEDEDAVFVRAVGCSDERAAEVVRAFTPAGGRPEPLRVARLAARAAREYRG